MLQKTSTIIDFTWAGQLRATLLNSWFNLFLFLVPSGFVVRYTPGQPIATFLVNFFAIVPLSFGAERAISELTLRIGENWGGLAYITIRLAAM